MIEALYVEFQRNLEGDTLELKSSVFQCVPSFERCFVRCVYYHTSDSGHRSFSNVAKLETRRYFDDWLVAL